MARHFNTAGPCMAQLHYMLPPERRLPGLRALIDVHQYVVVHAPRQSGKTTILLNLAKELTAEGRYAALLASCEEGQAVADPDAAERAVVRNIVWNGEASLPEGLRPTISGTSPGGAIRETLSAWSASCPRPVVLFLDEIDALIDDALLRVLRQLRAGYAQRPAAFPQSVTLIGLRDVRDYKIGIRPERESLGTSSPFNVKVRSFTLGNFTQGEVADLYAQHTEETGQRFEPEAVARAYDLSRGQPWLVNALAQEVTWTLVTDRTVPITVAHIDAAKDDLVRRRDTHLDSLSDKLREPRVRRVIEPIIAGLTLPPEVSADDVDYAMDLGLIIKNGKLEIANPIYREVIPRTLHWVMEGFLPDTRPSWRAKDGGLDWEEMLRLFLAFWLEHGESLLLAAPYHEAAPHLVFLAFLQRLVNSHGKVDREYAAGTGRMDILVRWPRPAGEQRFAAEIKVWRPGRPDPLTAGLEQLGEYLDRLGLDRGTLFVFDRRPDAQPLPERAGIVPAKDARGREVTVVRL